MECNEQGKRWRGYYITAYGIAVAVRLFNDLYHFLFRLIADGWKIAVI